MFQESQGWIQETHLTLFSPMGSLLFDPEACSLFFFKILFILFLERQEGKEKRGQETSLCGCLLHIPYWELACNPSMCRDWESNQ